MKKKSFVILLLVFIILSSNAQEKDIVYFANNTIAVKKQNDSIYFYNSLGKLHRIISFKNKKSTPYGLPKEVEKIIHNGKIPERIEISEETLSTYLYTERYADAGIVICSLHIYYNELGLRTGYKEICPNDIADGDDIHFGGKDLYRFNKYGLLIETEGILYTYNDNGQLVEKHNRNRGTKKVHRIAKYKYLDGKLIACVIQKINSNPAYNKTNTLKYGYNKKGLLSEIIQNKRSKIVLEYNNHNKVTSVSEVKTWRDKVDKHTYLTYDYDTKHNITKINIDHRSNYSDQELDFKYDDDGNLIQKMFDGKIIASYKYDSKGTLIYIEQNKRWGESKGYLKY